MALINDTEILPMQDAIDRGLYKPYEGMVTERKCPFCGKTLQRLCVRLGNLVTCPSRGYEHCTCEHADETDRLFEEEYQAKEKAKKEAEEAARLKERIDRAFRQSEMPDKWKKHSFDNFRTDGLSDAALYTFNRCRRYADWIAKSLRQHDLSYSPNGVFLTGPCGTGKTHLAAAILNSVMRQAPATPILAMTMQEMTAKIKDSYDEIGDSSEAELIKAYTEVPLLLIDDLGSEQPTEWSVDRIFRIINARYNANLPTIVTSNYDTAALGKRLTPKRYSDSGN